MHAGWELPTRIIRCLGKTGTHNSHHKLDHSVYLVPLGGGGVSKEDKTKFNYVFITFNAP